MKKWPTLTEVFFGGTDPRDFVSSLSAFGNKEKLETPAYLSGKGKGRKKKLAQKDILSDPAMVDVHMDFKSDITSADVNVVERIDFTKDSEYIRLYGESGEAVKDRRVKDEARKGAIPWDESYERRDEKNNK